MPHSFVQFFMSYVFGQIRCTSFKYFEASVPTVKTATFLSFSNFNLNLTSPALLTRIADIAFYAYKMLN